MGLENTYNFHVFTDCNRLTAFFLTSVFNSFNRNFTTTAFIMVQVITKKIKTMWQLLNFIVEEAKMAVKKNVYLSKRNKTEGVTGTDAITM